jgi:choline-glycine betaine transporter
MSKSENFTPDEALGANEEQVKKMLGRSPADKVLHRWISCGSGVIGAIRLNWVSSLMAIVILWGFAITCIEDDDASADFKEGKAWVSANFTWLYIGTQDVWCAFLIYLCFSRFGDLKLGGDKEKPRFNDFTWFCMLFTCGVAVGLYVFGVSEPLYFYRQPTIWHAWNYDYTIRKAGVENDAQRAQQAIFMAIYHWGIHGWVPYILLAILLGVVSHRWGMPMTIRSCFYPLIGDHALGLVGDFVDALSISTTTFGVCTSLGLGVTQLSSGLQFLKNMNCSVKDICTGAGGVWDITGYGANNCFCVTAAGGRAAYGDASCPQDLPSLGTCTLSWLNGNQDNFETSLYIIIMLVTTVATVSVLSGLDRGIKTLSQLAFSCGAMVLLVCLFRDNTWYLLNVMVQSTGYYLQYVIQVGFDCEAFQQLDFEFQDTGYGSIQNWAPLNNYYWGSAGDDSAIGVLVKAGFGGGSAASISSTTDCGAQPNPCNNGFISVASAMALYYASQMDATFAQTQQGEATSRLLKSFHMSEKSVELATNAMTSMVDIYDISASNAGLGLPCGSGPSNTTHFDKTNVEAFGMLPSALNTRLCQSTADGGIVTPEKVASCESFWASVAWPRCPQTTVRDRGLWGTCQSYMYNCPITKAYYDDTNPMFMDWWTIFYWAWWITWAPFVGFFVAIISKGRTVRNVIMGGFFCPTLFAIIWFSVFGGLAIKMERVAEVALKVRPEVQYASVTCSEHYSGGTPISPDSKRLAEAGYYLISCMPKDDQIYYVMSPYGNLSNFLWPTLWVGLVIYFLTSSDSGSMTDDIISACGLKTNKIPVWQKIFWCFTEGIVACALVAAGGDGKDALKTLQAASIIIGLPFTFILCMMVPATYRALKRELGEQDIIQSKRFNTQILDIFEGFKPNGGSPCSPAQHLTGIVTGLFAPGVAVYKAMLCAEPDSKVGAIGYAAFTQVLFICWIALHIAETGTAGTAMIGWLCMTGVLLIIAFGRGELRRKYDIWGSPLDDLFTTMCVYPIVCAQMQMQADTDGKDMPTYFATADQLQADMAALGGGALPTIASSTDDSPTEVTSS